MAHRDLYCVTRTKMNVFLLPFLFFLSLFSTHSSLRTHAFIHSSTSEYWWDNTGGDPEACTPIFQGSWEKDSHVQATMMLRIKGGEGLLGGGCASSWGGYHLSLGSQTTKRLAQKVREESGEKLGHLLFPLLTPGNQSSAFLSLWVSLQVCLL